MMFGRLDRNQGIRWFELWKLLPIQMLVAVNITDIDQQCHVNVKIQWWSKNDKKVHFQKSVKTQDNYEITYGHLSMCAANWQRTRVVSTPFPPARNLNLRAAGFFGSFLAQALSAFLLQEALTEFRESADMETWKQSLTQEQMTAETAVRI